MLSKGLRQVGGCRHASILCLAVSAAHDLPQVSDSAVMSEQIRFA